MKTEELIPFDDPEDSFYAIPRSKDSDAYYIEYGNDFHSELKFMSDDDLINWAMEMLDHDQEEFEDTEVNQKAAKINLS